jgi:hypothetical protein
MSIGGMTIWKLAEICGWRKGSSGDRGSEPNIVFSCPVCFGHIGMVIRKGLHPVFHSSHKRISTGARIKVWTACGVLGNESYSFCIIPISATYDDACLERYYWTSSLSSGV